MLLLGPTLAQGWLRRRQKEGLHSCMGTAACFVPLGPHSQQQAALDRRGLWPSGTHLYVW